MQFYLIKSIAQRKNINSLHYSDFLSASEHADLLGFKRQRLSIWPANAFFSGTSAIQANCRNNKTNIVLNHNRFIINNLKARQAINPKQPVFLALRLLVITLLCGNLPSASADEAAVVA
jgi:hypothetical protein